MDRDLPVQRLRRRSRRRPRPRSLSPTCGSAARGRAPGAGARRGSARRGTGCRAVGPDELETGLPTRVPVPTAGRDRSGAEPPATAEPRARGAPA